MQEVHKDLEGPQLPSLKELVKGNDVDFSHFRAGFFYYNIIDPDNSPQDEVYQFPVPLNDVGNATMLSEDKAITYMRWIRKAIGDKTLVKL